MKGWCEGAKENKGVLLARSQKVGARGVDENRDIGRSQMMLEFVELGFHSRCSGKSSGDQVQGVAQSHLFLYIFKRSLYSKD